jgi:HYDIN/CFA65/VesB-like, Ig-like domain
VVLGTKVPDIGVSPIILGFGEVMLLKSRTQAITVSNVGSKDLVVNSVAFEGPPADFSLFSSLTTPFTLAPGNNQTISITYSPRAMGDASAILAITSNDPDTSKVVVSLNGTGVASQAPADEQVSQIADVIQTAIATGTLTPTMPGNQATQLIDQIFSAKQMAAAGKSAAACAQLKNALQRVDGNPIPPDFLEGPDRELVRQLIQNTIESVGCK